MNSEQCFESFIDRTDFKIVKGDYLKTVSVFMFSGCNMQSLELPCVKLINNFGFKNCYNLTQVLFKQLKKVDKEAFYKCNRLQEFIAPLLTTIGCGAFGYCSELSTCTTPLVQSVGQCAFYKCAKLETPLFKKKIRF